MKSKWSIYVGLAFSVSAFAQDANLPGTYAGSYSTGVNTTVTIKLTVKSVENGVVKGSAYRSSTARGGGQCAGEYPVEGTLKDNDLDVVGKVTQRDGDCTLRLRAKVTGGQLEAKVAGNDFVMRK